MINITLIHLTANIRLNYISTLSIYKHIMVEENTRDKAKTSTTTLGGSNPNHPQATDISSSALEQANKSPGEAKVTFTFSSLCHFLTSLGCIDAETKAN